MFGCISQLKVFTLQSFKSKVLKISSVVLTMISQHNSAYEQRGKSTKENKNYTVEHIQAASYKKKSKQANKIKVNTRCFASKGNL